MNPSISSLQFLLRFTLVVPMVDLSADCVTFVRTVVPTVAFTVNFDSFDVVNYIFLFMFEESFRTQAASPSSSFYGCC